MLSYAYHMLLKSCFQHYFGVFCNFPTHFLIIMQRPPSQRTKKRSDPRRSASYYPSFYAGSHLDQRIDILSLQRIQNVALVPRHHVFAGGCFKLSAAFCAWCRQVVSFKQVNDVLCCRNRIFANDCACMNDE